MPIEIAKCGGELFLDGETLHRTGFCLTGDLNRLAVPSIARTDNVAIAGLGGRIGRTLGIEQGEHQLEAVLVGDVSVFNGVALDDPEEGFELNLDWIVENWLAPPDWETNPESARELTWVRPSGATRTARAQVVGLSGIENATRGYDQTSTWTVGALCTLDIVVLDGVPA